jgi:hypothetical protein
MRASRPKAQHPVADFFSATLAGFYSAVDSLRIPNLGTSQIKRFNHILTAIIEPYV